MSFTPRPILILLFIQFQKRPVSTVSFKPPTSSSETSLFTLKMEAGSLFETSMTITSIYEPKNTHIISHKTILKHFKTLRHVSILSDHHQGVLFLLKLYYIIHNSIRICKRAVVAACHVVWECVVEQWLGVRRTTHT